MSGLSSILNIVRIVAILVAIVAVFVVIPHIAAILVVLGIIGGLDTPQDRRLPVMVMALVLMGLNTTLDAIPAVGAYLGGIAGNIGITLTGVAFTVITMAIIERLTGKVE